MSVRPRMKCLLKFNQITTRFFVICQETNYRVSFIFHTCKLWLSYFCDKIVLQKFHKKERHLNKMSKSIWSTRAYDVRFPFYLYLSTCITTFNIKSMSLYF